MANQYIVLIEDNPDDVALTMRAFRKSNLHSDVRTFPDGVEALEFLQGYGRYVGRDVQDSPEFILLDLKLPRLSGHDVLAQLRRHDATRLVPVVMLTTSQEKDDLVKSYSLGANSYIRKPVDFSRFTELVQTVGQYWLVLNQSVR